jgi:SAM-dependent methyltransferase
MSKGNLVAANREFYDALWSRAHLERPNRFNTWPLISGLFSEAPARLEIGPGLRPRLPIPGTHFLDISAPVIERLNARGGRAVPGEITALPYRDGEFDLVCAFDVVEHAEDDQQAFRELSRVLQDGALLVFSVPLHEKCWTGFDDLVGHARRYEPAALLARIEGNGLTLEKSAAFGMAPKNPRLLKFGMACLAKHRTVAMHLYNWVFIPLGHLFQKRLRFGPGLIDTKGVDEILLVCRRRRRTPHSIHSTGGNGGSGDAAEKRESGKAERRKMATEGT